MREGVLSAGMWHAARAKVAEAATVAGGERILRPVARWDAERFACDQIRGLVRQVFAPSLTPPVRQVVFSAVDAETDVRGICERVGQTLAAQTIKDVAIVTSGPVVLPRTEVPRMALVRQMATQIRGNLWSVPLRGNVRSVGPPAAAPSMRISPRACPRASTALT